MNFLLRLIWQLPSRDFMRGKRKAFFIKVQGVPATFPEWRHTVKTTYSRKYQTFFWYRDLMQMEIWVLYQGMTSIYGMLKNPWAATKKRCRLLLCLHVVSFPIDLVLNTDAVQEEVKEKSYEFPLWADLSPFLASSNQLYTKNHAEMEKLTKNMKSSPYGILFQFLKPLTSTQPTYRKCFSLYAHSSWVVIENSCNGT